MAFQYWPEGSQAPMESSVPSTPRNAPDWATGATADWWQNVYKQSGGDLGRTNENLASQANAFRSRYGDDAPEDDASIYQMIASGQAPPSKAQQSTPTQQWTGGTSGGIGAGTSNALMALLMQRAQQGSTVDRTDPNVRAQVDPFAAQLERAQRNYLDDIAERSGGRPYNMQGEQRMAAEKLGQQTGELESQVVGREIEGRRAEIQQALAQWGDVLSQDQRLSLQQELAQMDDNYRRQALSQSGDQFMRELALRQWDSENSDYYRRAGI